MPRSASSARFYFIIPMLTKLKKRKKDWFRIKRYPHIGFPLQPADKKWIERYLINKEAIAKHAFYPFVHRKLEVRKFRREICHDGTRSTLRCPSKKQREIYFSTHIDSNIYSYYSELLYNEYEKSLTKYGITECVTAYRRLSKDPENPNSRNKCNIDFANDIFTYIKSGHNSDLVAITFDIKAFFDSLDHVILKRYWKQVVETGKDLPPDQYNVYRNITKFSYIEENDIFATFKRQILVERSPDVVRRLSVDKIGYLRNQRAVAYCEKMDIDLLRNKNLIKSNKYVYQDGTKRGLRVKGIPQGSPISAILANIYMVEFDKSVNEFIKDLGGIYRRYSDDMIVVCDLKNTHEVIEYFAKHIEAYKLEIQSSKTQVFEFHYNIENSRHYCFERILDTGKLLNRTSFEYLGFQFDGRYTLLKNSSLAGYYRKMKRSIASRKFYAYHNNTETRGKIFKSRIYKRFTFKGKTRRRIYRRDPIEKDRFYLSTKFDWGNFLTYATLASEIISDNKILSQVRRHWNIFHSVLRKAEGKK